MKLLIAKIILAITLGGTALLVLGVIGYRVLHAPIAETLTEVGITVGVLAFAWALVTVEEGK